MSRGRIESNHGELGEGGQKKVPVLVLDASNYDHRL
jgi:hypothetical protein